MARPRAYVAEAVPWVAAGALPPTRDVHGQPLIRLQTLGAAVVQCGETRIGPSAGVLFALLLRLTHAPAMRVPRDVLLEALWPTQSDVRRRASLRQALYKLRGFGVRVGLDGDVVQLDTAQLVRTFASERTAARFERDVTIGREPFGPFLPGYVAPTEPLEEWVAIEREAVHADVRQVLVSELRSRRERADWSGAEALARWLLRFDPLHEDATLVVAECTMLNGAKTEAIAILDRYLSEIGPGAGDIRLPAMQLRRRFVEATRGRLSFAPTERHFIGRDDELTALTLAMRRARWREGSAVLLHGPSGIGKTRMTIEAGKVATVEGVREVRASCCESDGVRILSVVFDLLPALLAQPGALGCEPESMATLRRLIPDTRALQHRHSGGEPPAGSWSGDSLASDEGAGSAETVGADGPVEPQRSAGVSEHSIESVLAREPLPMPSSIRRAIVDLIAAVSDERPLLLVIDNVHWLDSSSWDVLADLVERASEMRLVVMLTSRVPFACATRPERVPSALTVRELPPLTAESSATLARLIGEDLSAPMSDAICTWLVDACEGSPLFLRSLVNHWIETGEAGGVPPTLQQVIEQRIAKLSPDALRTLQTIALLGEMASVERLERTLGLGVYQLLESIDELEGIGALAQSTPARISSHELIGKGSVQKLSRLTASAIHDRIAEVLVEDIRRSGSTSLLPEIAGHWRASGNQNALSEFVSAELPRLVLSGDPASSLIILESAIEADERVSEDPIVARANARLRLEAGDYARSLRQWSCPLTTLDASACNTVEQAEDALTIVDSAYRADPLVDRKSLLEFAVALSKREPLGPATRLRAAEIALVIAANMSDSSLASDCFRGCGIDDGYSASGEQRVGLLYHTIFGDRAISHELATRILATARRARPSTQRYHDFCRAGFAFRFSAGIDEVVAAFTKGFETAEELKLPRLAQYAAWQLATVLTDAGISAGAAHWNSVLTNLFVPDDDVVASSFVLAHLCRVAILNRDYDTAKSYEARHARALPRLPVTVASSFATALEIGVELLDEGWSPTEEQLDIARARYARTSPSGPSDFFSAVLIRAHLRLGRSAEAEQLLTQYLTTDRREVLPLSKDLEQAISELRAYRKNL